MRDADTGSSREDRPTRPGDLFDQAATLARISERLLGEAQAPSIGRYQLLKPIGRGAMGVVYAAYDDQLDRKLALKVQAGVASDPQRRESALREGRALASLTHPSIVTIHEVGVHEDAFFLAMEFVDGSGIDGEQDGERLDRARLWSDLADAADGLAAAHAAGLVHGDVKPSNVLRARDGRIKVVDFGLARPASSGRTVPSDIDPGETSSGDTSPSQEHFGGTPAYVAPEQALGEAMTARSDQYAFAVMAWELLTGELPYGATDRATLIEQKLAGAPGSAAPGASRLSRREFRALTRAMSPDPGARFGELDDLVRAARPDRRWRRLALGGGALGILGLAWTFGREPPPKEPVDPCADEVAQLDVYLPDQLGASTPNPGAPVDAATQELRSRGEQRLRVAGERWRQLARRACEAHERGETSDAVYAAYEQCFERGVKVLAASAESLSAPQFKRQAVSSALLNLHVIEWCGPQRQALIERDLERGDSPMGSDNIALGLANRVGGLWGNGEKEKARELLPALRETTRESKDPFARAESWRQIGIVSPDERERLDALGRALALAMRERMDNSALVSAGDLATALSQTPGGRAEARRTLELVLVWAESILAGADGEHLREGLAPYLGRLQNLSGILASDDGELGLAREAYREALRLWEPDRAWRPVRSVHAMNNLALLATQSGDDAAAASHYAQAIELIDARMGRKSHLFQIVSTNRAEAALAAGQLQAARGALADAEESRRLRDVDERSPNEHYLWARIAWERGDAEKALAGFETTCAAFDSRGNQLNLAVCEAWRAKVRDEEAWSVNEARAAIEHAREAGAGPDLVAELNALGVEGALYAGQLEEASAFMRGAREATSEAPELSEALRVRLDLLDARLEMQLGQGERARSLMASARAHMGARANSHPLRQELDLLAAEISGSEVPADVGDPHRRRRSSELNDRPR